MSATATPAPATTPTGEEAPHRQHHTVTLCILVMALMAYALQQTLVAPAMPAIQDELGVSTTAITYLLTAFLLTGSVATPIFGRLGDMFGKKRMLVITLATFAVGSLVCALSHSIEVLIAGRAIQGVGSAVFPLAFGIIRDEFPREKVAGGVGLLSATFGIGGGFGIVLSGVIVDNFDYEWIFWLGLVGTLIALVAAQLFIPESPIKTPGKVDWTGAALLSTGLVGVLVAVSQGNVWGWLDARIVGLFVGSAILLVIWVVFETKHPLPLVDMKMMRRRTVLTGNLAGVLLGFSMFCGFILIPKFVQAPDGAGYGFGSTVTQAGLFMLPSSIIMLAAGPISGWMCGRFGSKTPLLLGTFLTMFAYAFMAAAHSEQWMMYFAVTLSGLGIGFSFAAMANLIIEAVEPTKTGVAVGMNTIMRTVGGAIGGQVGASILMAHTGDSGLPDEAGYTVAFAVLAGGLVVALLLILAIPGRRSAGQREHHVAVDLAAEAGAPFPDGASLCGRLHLADPAIGAVVTVLSETGREVAHSSADATGAFRLDLAQGRYFVVASGPGHEPAAAVVEVDGSPVVLELTLRTAAPIEVAPSVPPSPQNA